MLYEYMYQMYFQQIDIFNDDPAIPWEQFDLKEEKAHTRALKTFKCLLICKYEALVVSSIFLHLIFKLTYIYIDVTFERTMLSFVLWEELGGHDTLQRTLDVKTSQLQLDILT